MPQLDLFYSYSSITLTAVLFILIVLNKEIVFRIGRFVQNRSDTEIKSLTASVQASVLGLLALLLGFTFTIAMQRYDHRSQALIDEVNAIGTAVLRVQLLPAKYKNEASDLFRKYIDLRIAIGKIDLTKQDARKKYNNQISDIQTKLWAVAVLATRDDPRPVTTGAFVTSLNGVIDSQGKRNALLQMHVPEIVLLLLFIVFISTGGIIGYSTGLSGKRVLIPTVLVSFLIALIVFIIIDLDRPKRGLIQVDQGIMLELRERINHDS